MQYTSPNIVYDVNRLSINSSYPCSPALQGINYLILYISGFPHRPIMYPSGLYCTTTHNLRQEVPQVNSTLKIYPMA